METTLQKNNAPYFTELVIATASGAQHFYVYYSDKYETLEEISLNLKAKKMLTINDKVSINPSFIVEIFEKCRGKIDASNSAE